MAGFLEEWLLPIVLAVVVSYGSIRILLSNMCEIALDVPNHRSLHDAPVPRTGGWALVVGCVTGLAVSSVSISLPLVTGFALLLAVSVLDDLRHVSARMRLIAHLVAVTLVLLALPQPISWWWYPLLLLAGAWMVNLYNFMDGMDGLAGSMTVIGFASMGLIAAWRGQSDIAGVCALLVVCALVFLRYNWPKASIFLGDAGSTSLGLAAVAISLIGWQREAFGLLVPIVVFAPFWLDASLTLLRRILSGKRWWEAHREHFYQRCALRVGVKKTLYQQLGVMLGASALSFLLVGIGIA